MDKVIVFAIPVFSILIAAEVVYGWKKKRNTYRLNDAISSLSQGVLSQLVASVTQIFQIGFYTMIYSSVAVVRNDAWWNAWYGWILAVLCYDFCDYWLHRMSHESALLWAAHAVHHQSQDFNFSTALRQESAYMLLGWVFFVPMALLGVPPENFAIAGLVVLLYQFWIHTEHVGKLGWFDRVFSSPSNHRVHHAVNPQYIDKNYGAILVLWDRMFGTFSEEREKCAYGTLAPLNSWDPLWAIVGGYWKLAQNAWHAPRWADKLRIWYKPPGWQPDAVSQMPAPTATDGAQARRYDPPTSRAAKWCGGVQFLLLLAASGAYLWQAEQLPARTAAILLFAITMGLWSVGAVLQARIRISTALLLDVVAVALGVWALGLF
ncbi:sterol desaturase family protein [Paraherbaspirillum soli]|uniref:Sterol desaturase family protein n=1 Tax=Paraherbaspirillum soli TaxID=631222 RepID=A0ABW0M5N0_9BURK